MSYDSGDAKRFARKYPGVARSEADHELVNRFTYHPPLAGQPELYEMLRSLGLEFARALNSYCPAGRELSLAITAVDQAVMWANAAIARNSE